MRLGRDAVDAAERLGAAHVSERGHSAIIVGQGVADQLVADQLKQTLKNERARARARREQDAARTRNGDCDAAPVNETLEQVQERRREERAAELEARGRGGV